MSVCGLVGWCVDSFCFVDDCGLAVGCCVAVCIAFLWMMIVVWLWVAVLLCVLLFLG